MITKFLRQFASIWQVQWFLVALLLTGCASARKTTSARPTPSVVADKAFLPAEPTLPVVSEVPIPATEPAPHREIVIPRETLASQVRKLLPPSCAVIEATATSIVLRGRSPAPSSSLYEDAIALSELRGLLSSRKIPSATTQHTTLRNGTATIPFPPNTPPDSAASALTAASNIRGIQKIRADFLP